jgi:hypothetical protein
MLRVGSQADVSSSSGSGGCVSAGEVIGIAFACFIGGAFVTWGSVIVSRCQKPPEKITANGNHQGDIEVNDDEDD